MCIDAESESPHDARPIAIVTGAGGGIGAAIASELGTRGYALVLLDADSEALAASSAALPAGAVVESVVADVSDSAAWATLSQRLGDQGSRVSLLVNNAGVLLAGRLTECTAEDARRVVEINFLGALLGCREIGALLAENTDNEAPMPIGVLNIASIFASLTPPGFAAYNASKAALVALTETLSGEWRDAGVQATVVLPGVTRTNLFSRASYASDTLASVVIDRGTAGSLSAAQVAHEALRRYAAGQLIAPVGRRARWRYWLRGWFPSLVRGVVAKQANRVLSDTASKPR